MTGQDMLHVLILVIAFVLLVALAPLLIHGRPKHRAPFRIWDEDQKDWVARPHDHPLRHEIISGLIGLGLLAIAPVLFWVLT